MNDLPEPPELVRDLMTVGVESCSPNTPLSDLLRLFIEQGLEAVVVLNSDRHAVGAITPEELVRALDAEDLNVLTAEHIMREGLPEVPADIPLKAAAQIMHDQGVRAVFIMHRAGGFGYPAAVLTYRHLLRALAMASGQDDLLDLGIKAERESPVDTFLRRREETRRRNIGQDR